MRGGGDVQRLAGYNKKKRLILIIRGRKKMRNKINSSETIKLHGNYKEWTVSQSQLGRILEISQPRVNQLIEEEVVMRDESSKTGAVLLIESLRNYYRSKAPIEDGEGKVDFWKERGLHERAKRKITELELKKRRGELYAAETVERVMIEQLTNFRNKLLGLPAKLAAVLEGKTRGEIYELINLEIEAALEELSTNYKGADLNEDDKDAEEEDAAGAETD